MKNLGKMFLALAFVFGLVMMFNACDQFKERKAPEQKEERVIEKKEEVKIEKKAEQKPEQKNSNK